MAASPGMYFGVEPDVEEGIDYESFDRDHVPIRVVVTRGRRGGDGVFGIHVVVGIPVGIIGSVVGIHVGIIGWVVGIPVGIVAWRGRRGVVVVVVMVVPPRVVVVAKHQVDVGDPAREQTLIDLDALALPGPVPFGANPLLLHAIPASGFAFRARRLAF